MSTTRDRLLPFVKAHVLHGDFTLSSGKKSSYYLDGRRISLDPEGLVLLADALLPLVPAEAEAVGGPTLGADPIISAMAVRAFEKGRKLKPFIVRKEPKGHGTGKMVEGNLEKGTRCVVVEDTVTSGASLLKAIRALEAEGHKVIKVLAMLDRREGGTEALAPWGLESLFGPADLGVLPHA